MPAKLFSGVLLLALLASCKPHLSISSSSAKLIPYSGDEKLLFVSTAYDTLDIYLTGIETKPKDIKKEAKQYSAEQMLYQCNTKQGIVEITFAALSASPEGDVFVLNLFNKGHYIFEKEILVTELLKAGMINYKCNTVLYTDVVVIKNTTALKQDFYAEKCYWSKSKGLIAFKEKSGMLWYVQ